MKVLIVLLPMFFLLTGCKFKHFVKGREYREVRVYYPEEGKPHREWHKETRWEKVK